VAQGSAAVRPTQIAPEPMNRGIETFSQRLPMSCCDGSGGTRWHACKPRVIVYLRLENGAYCDPPPATIRASAHLTDQVSPFALDGRQGPRPTATSTALWGHITPVPGREDSVGSEGGR
jgi:hypothetical protein